MAISSLFFCLEVPCYMFCFTKKCVVRPLNFITRVIHFEKKMTAFYKHDKGQIIIFQ